MISNSPLPSRSVSFGARLATSGAFIDLFRDGMALVEETATYLDGEGREAARDLTRTAALAYGVSQSLQLATCPTDHDQALLGGESSDTDSLARKQMESEKRGHVMYHRLCQPDIHRMLAQACPTGAGNAPGVL